MHAGGSEKQGEQEDSSRLLGSLCLLFGVEGMWVGWGQSDAEGGKGGGAVALSALESA